MGAEIIIASAALAVSAVGSVIQASAQKRAQKAAARRAQESAAAQRRAEEAQQRAADLQAARRRRQLLRESRIQRARAVQAGVSQGLGLGSSLVQGAEGQSRTELAGAISFLDQTRSFNKLAATEFGRAREIAARPLPSGSSVFGSILQGVGGFAMSNAGAIAGMLPSGGSPGPYAMDSTGGFTNYGGLHTDMAGG